MSRSAGLCVGVSLFSLGTGILIPISFDVSLFRNRVRTLICLDVSFLSSVLLLASLLLRRILSGGVQTLCFPLVSARLLSASSLFRSLQGAALPSPCTPRA